MKKHPSRSALWPALFAVALIAGCDGDFVVNPDDDGPIRFETIYKSQDSDISEQFEEIVSSSAEWERIWDDIGAGGAPPRVDFGRENVAIVTGGVRPDACHAVEIVDVRHDDGILQVDAELIEPGTGCVCPQVVVRPVHAVVFRRIFALVDFDVRRVVENCR